MLQLPEAQFPHLYNGDSSPIRSRPQLKPCRLLSSAFPLLPPPQLSLSPTSALQRIWCLTCGAPPLVLVTSISPPLRSLPSSPQAGWGPHAAPLTPGLCLAACGRQNPRMAHKLPTPVTQLYHRSLPLSVFSIRGWEPANVEGCLYVEGGGSGRNSRDQGGHACRQSRGGGDGQRLEEQVAGRAPRVTAEVLWVCGRVCPQMVRDLKERTALGALWAFNGCFRN